MTQPKFKNKYRVESTRLPNRDYGANGWYFVTICTKESIDYFGCVVSGQMQLSPIGEIAKQFWTDIPNHFQNTHIDSYVIMPNHVHGIVIIDRPTDLETRNTNNVETQNTNNVETQNTNNVETRHGASLQTVGKTNKFGPLKPGSLPTIINAYKSSVTRWCRKNGHDNFGWQPRYYEHIIRTDDSLDRIREYIINNPTKWDENKNQPTNLWM